MFIKILLVIELNIKYQYIQLSAVIYNPNIILVFHTSHNVVHLYQKRFTFFNVVNVLTIVVNIILDMIHYIRQVLTFHSGA